MKKILLLLASAALLFAGCQKEQITVTEGDGNTVEVTVNAQLLNEELTKASWDNDGNGGKVDHWIMEVYDSKGKRYDRQEKTGQSGLTNTFNLILIKGQSYKFAFWADKLGSYKTEKLTEIQTVSNVAGLDSRDAFFANKAYTPDMGNVITAKLYRPFAQINVVTLDLNKIFTQMTTAGTADEYGKNIPTDLKLSCEAYTKFDVLTGTASDAQATELTLASCYADFSTHAAKTTIFMDYLFADDETGLKNLEFSFKSLEAEVNYSFANIPLQRNYRTNISGNLLSNDAVVNVEIIPIWAEPEYEEELWAPGMITEVEPDEQGVYNIERPSQLAWIAQQVNEEGNSFTGKTVKLAKDIDLNNGAWVSIGQTGAGQFSGTFDGQEHTISNLNIKNDDGSGFCSTGFFGWLNGATVKNVKFDKAKVAGHHNVGVIAGYMEGTGCTITGCSVSNATVSCSHINDDADGDKCGGIVGFAGNAGTPVSNCTVSNTAISAGRDAGQVAGAAKEANITDCSASQVSVTADGSSTSANIRNELIGRTL